ncbi:hypothetical protein TMEN_5555 [Trichophyton mentagrophytes]|nr:hypothetical protein TMEN_5555 [Trichophyton mentagrophytes]
MAPRKTKPAPKSVPRQRAGRGAVQKTRAPKKTESSISNTIPKLKLNVYVFGSGSSAELGLGPKNAIDVKRPRLNTNLDAEKVGVVDIGAGGMHAAALTHNNHILTWGVNDNCALGRETTWDGGLKDMADDDESVASDEVELNPREAIPTAIPREKFPEGTKFCQVAAGDSATFALTEDGLVYGWGSFVTTEGERGWWNGEHIKMQSNPVMIPGLEKIVQISAGNNFCLALDHKGRVFSWGRPEQDQLGRHIRVDRRKTAGNKNASIDKLRNDIGLVPGLVALPKSKRIISIHAGSDHSFAIDSNGDTWTWGLNNFGQTAVNVGAGKGGSTIVRPQKATMLIGQKMKMIQGGRHHSIGITKDGQCLVWGRMDGAQMGIDYSTLHLDDPQVVISERGKPRILLEPTPLPIPNCTFAAAGSDHNVLITSEGKAYTWGINATYQCGQGPDTDDILVATKIDNPSLREKVFSWAGAGGQYSILASVHVNEST